MKAEENLIIMDSYQNGMTINYHVDIDNDRDEEVAKFLVLEAKLLALIPTLKAILVPLMISYPKD